MSNNNSILLIDPAFDPNQASSCNLLIKIGIDSFSYAIIDKETAQVNAVFDEQECENVTLSFIERLKTDSYLSLPFQQVKIAAYTANILTIPNELYQEEQLDAHTQFFTEANHANQLYVHAQNHFGFTTVFTLPKQLDEVVNTFSAGKKYQQNAGLLALAEQMKETSLVLDFTANAFHALYIHNGQVVFQQSYEIDQVEEFNYYLLLMINQLNINPTATTLHISGIIHEGDDIYNCLLKYFNTASFLSLPEQLDQKVLDDMPSHYYTSLLALDQCV